MSLPKHYSRSLSSTSPSTCRSEFEVAYHAYDPETPSSSTMRTNPSVFRSPDMSNSMPGSTMRPSYRDPLRTIHSNSRVLKTDHAHELTYRHHRNDHLHHASQLHRHRDPSPGYSDEQPTDLYRRSSLETPLYRNPENILYEDFSHPQHQQQQLQQQQYRQEQQQQRSLSLSSPVRLSSISSPRRRSAPSLRKSTPLALPAGPRSATGRLPSLFDRIKAALEESKRPTITTSPLPPPIRTSIKHSPHSEYHPPTSPLFSQEDFMATHLENSMPSPGSVMAAMAGPITLFGMPCSEASQRSYSKHNGDVRKSFHRLQQMDSGTVQYRTIAFSTHLTVSRWEPSDASTTSSASASTTSIKKTPSPVTSSVATFAEEDEEKTEEVTKIGSKCLTPASEQKQPQQSPPSGNDISQAARLMSLANYIRHIITLTSGRSLLHSPSALMQQRLVAVQQQQQQLRQEQLRKLQGWKSLSSSTEILSSNKETHLYSPLSAGPGPIKPSASLSTRRHRHASEYHDHQLRRQLHHSQPFQQREQNPLPSPISPLIPMGGSLAHPQKSTTKQNQTTLPFPPLLSIPFPNLTLTLALIYVDRLKAKYPEAKGEPGCSHRLFLVAYIIAAKYRCIVELAALMKESDNVGSADEDDADESQDAIQTESTKDNQCKPIEERLSEARSHAELIFSNHEWVRLLSLGSFFRPLNSVAAGAAASTPVTDNNASKVVDTTLPTQPIARSSCDDALLATQKHEPKSLLIQAVPPVAAATAAAGDTKNEVKVGQGVNPRPAAMQATILQVEDLDRMEAEFLTFLSFDLSTRHQDIDTCWNLLVGNLGA